MNIMLVIVALLFNLLTGNGTANISNTTSVDSSAWANPNYLVQLMYMYGGNVDMNRAYEQEYDKTYVFEDGYQAYGWGKGSSVRVHGNMNTGIYFDFDIKVDQHQLQCSFSTLHRLIWCRAIQQVKETCLPKAVITKSLRVN